MGEGASGNSGHLRVGVHVGLHDDDSWIVADGQENVETVGFDVSYIVFTGDSWKGIDRRVHVEWLELHDRWSEVAYERHNMNSLAIELSLEGIESYQLSLNGELPLLSTVSTMASPTVEAELRSIYLLVAANAVVTGRSYRYGCEER